MLSKAACFTDIHWGRKNNSEQHNQDCLRYIRWFCEKVKSDKSIDHIVFMGDWFEHRNAINGLTMDHAYDGACLIKDLELPVYFIVGNHDLYYRTTREVYATKSFDSLGFNIINTPTIINDIGQKGTLMCPFLFEHEYADLAQYFKIPVWFGHFEFKGFILTGETKNKEHGPDPKNFKKPLRIFSGHYHKRQSSSNITYIGNTFPADFSDANDTSRGMMVYEHGLDDTFFYDWEDAPSYTRTTLSEIINDPSILKKDAIVNCVVDKDITYEQSIKLKEQLTRKYELREIMLHESSEQSIALESTEVNEEELNTIETTDGFVKNMLSKIEVETIDNDKLIQIYGEL
jgi:DNA repair exonuclease SbcCD nuclease subunit